MSYIDLLFVPAFFIAIGLGFLSCRLLGRRAMREWHEEIAELWQQLGNAERLISRHLVSRTARTSKATSVPTEPLSPVTGPRKEVIASEISDDVAAEKGLLEPRLIPARKVKITKVFGQDNGIELGSSFIGLEQHLPEVGRTYNVIIEQDKIFRSSHVKQYGTGYIRTEEALYQLEVISDKGTPEEWKRVTFIDEHLEKIKDLARGVSAEDRAPPSQTVMPDQVEDMEDIWEEGSADKPLKTYGVLTWLFWGWIVLAVVVNLVAATSVLLSTDRFGDAINEFVSWYSPLNLSNWLLEALLFSPALVIYLFRARLTRIIHEK